MAFLYLPFPATISFVSQSFLHQQITKEYFTYMISPFRGCKVDNEGSLFNTNVKLTIQHNYLLFITFLLGNVCPWCWCPSSVTSVTNTTSTNSFCEIWSAISHAKHCKFIQVESWQKNQLQPILFSCSTTMEQLQFRHVSTSFPLLVSTYGSKIFFFSVRNMSEAYLC